MTDYLIGVHQKIPDYLTKIMFLVKGKLQVSQVLSPGLVSWALAQVMPFGACGVLFNKVFVVVFTARFVNLFLKKF